MSHGESCLDEPQAVRVHAVVARHEPESIETFSSSRRPFTFTRCNAHTTTAPEVALIITTYRKPWHLERVLESVAIQQGIEGRFEVVITDDGSLDTTPAVVAAFARSVTIPVTFTTHEHSGFQVARCRNEGVLVSNAPYLLFLDGDCVLPADHVLHHLRQRQRNVVMCGYCYRLAPETSARFSQAAIRSQEFTQWVSRAQVRDLTRRDWKASFYQLLRHPRKPALAGGNCGMWRCDFERVNGFDENFEGWGGEDTDLGCRLRRAGISLRSILRWTRTYHLWHPPDASAPHRIREGNNQKYLQLRRRPTRCVHGLVPPQAFRV